MIPVAHAFDVEAVKQRLSKAGGYEVVHSSPGLEIGVYVLVAPEPDRQQPHEDDEVYIVLEGAGVLEVEGQKVELREGHALFVPAHAEHRFSGYESLSLLVIFACCASRRAASSIRAATESMNRHCSTDRFTAAT
jgi:mannose-6-phosphate isomerase-like protein (cupin superfamily)